MLGLRFPVSDVLLQTLGVPGRLSQVVMALPAGIFGGSVWWMVVERRRSYGYVAGTFAGASATVGTVGFWLLVFVAVWGPELVLAGAVLIAFVAALAVPVGLLTGLSFMLLRRRFGTTSR